MVRQITNIVILGLKARRLKKRSQIGRVFIASAMHGEGPLAPGDDQRKGVNALPDQYIFRVFRVFRG